MRSCSPAKFLSNKSLSLCSNVRIFWCNLSFILMLTKLFAHIKCLIYLWPNVGDGDCGSERQKVQGGAFKVGGPALLGAKSLFQE